MQDRYTWDSLIATANIIEVLEQHFIWKKIAQAKSLECKKYRKAIEVAGIDL
jgi:hypothetical protein